MVQCLNARAQRDCILSAYYSELQCINIDLVRRWYDSPYVLVSKLYIPSQSRLIVLAAKKALFHEALILSLEGTGRHITLIPIFC